MKLNDEVESVSAVRGFILVPDKLDMILNVFQESIVATTKAAELFVALLAEQAQQICIYNNRKTIKVTSFILHVNWDHVFIWISSFSNQVDDILLAIESNQPKFAFLNEAFGGPKTQ